MMLDIQTAREHNVTPLPLGPRVARRDVSACDLETTPWNEPSSPSASRRRANCRSCRRRSRARTLFAHWAREHQKVKASRVKLITDAKGPVSRDRIFDTIEQITRPGIHRAAHRLLLGARHQLGALRAVAPLARARRSGCRGELERQRVRRALLRHRPRGVHLGRLPHRRRQHSGATRRRRRHLPEREAERRGEAGRSVLRDAGRQPGVRGQDRRGSTSRFTAAFTKVLLEALQGKAPGLIETQDGAGFIRPRPLKRHLATAVPIFFSRLKLPGKESSLPDARIESDPDAWIATLDAPALDRAAAAGRRGGHRACAGRQPSQRRRTPRGRRPRRPHERGWRAAHAAAQAATSGAARPVARPRSSCRPLESSGERRQRSIESRARRVLRAPRRACRRRGAQARRSRGSGGGSACARRRREP